jgi:hypothetical protein
VQPGVVRGEPGAPTTAASSIPCRFSISVANG